ncbi:hypothetical protein B0H13DRAFT_2667686 [Mycena leptocephala]|nr:hypothetical protein B0H13DRAFT_2667686 [Mycena leptocephala]
MPFAKTLQKAAFFVLSPVVCCWPRRRRDEIYLVRYPSALPADRIDIARSRPTIKQPPTCHLLRLPPELRRIVFEMAVGHRLVHLEMVILERNYILHTACYALSEAQDILNDMPIPADKIPIALLRTCRSVYVEVLPTIHTRNTFCFQLGDFPAAIQSGLGMYCLPDIRNLYLYHNYPTTSSEFVWARAHRILRRMRLETLTLRFGSKVDPSDFSVEKGWFRDLLIFRDWHLRSLDIFFRIGSLAGGPLPMTQTLRDLMIGPEADEKYKAFVLDESRKMLRALNAFGPKPSPLR